MSYLKENNFLKSISQLLPLGILFIAVLIDAEIA